MKSKLAIGILLAIFGVVIAAGPQSIFPVCGIHASGDSSAEMSRSSMSVGEAGEADDGTSMGDSHMKCWYTGKWEIAAGSIISLLGLLLVFLKNNKVRVWLFAAAFAAGVSALLIPTVLVGMCGNVHMACRVLTLPALIVFSGATILTSISGFAVSLKCLRGEKP